jgi:hypothetical protein
LGWKNPRGRGAVLRRRIKFETRDTYLYLNTEETLDSLPCIRMRNATHFSDQKTIFSTQRRENVRMPLLGTPRKSENE